MGYPGKKKSLQKLVPYMRIIKVKFWLSYICYINCYNMGKRFLFLYACLLGYWLEMAQKRYGVPAHHNRALNFAQHNKIMVLY